MAGRVIAVVCVLSSILIYSCSDSSDSPRVAALDAPPSDCLWTVEVTPGVDEADNVLHPDLNAGYWTALFAIPSDALCITLEGAFPHARNMSFNSAARGGRSISYIFDKDIVPELGSTNPFVPGNARNDPNRIYSIRVKSPGDEAVCPAPINEQNVISADVGFARIMYRIYANDASANLMGVWDCRV